MKFEEVQVSADTCQRLIADRLRAPLRTAATVALSVVNALIDRHTRFVDRVQLVGLTTAFNDLTHAIRASAGRLDNVDWIGHARNMHHADKIASKKCQYLKTFFVE